MPSKTVCPKRPDVCARQRLFELIDSLLSKKPLLWISGPPGAGKTSLAASYLEARNIDCLWYRIDKEGKDPATSLLDKIGAANQPGTREKKHFIIVFDNYQKLPADSDFHDILTDGINQLAESVSVVVISRIQPPSQFARMRAEQRIGFIDWQELRLTPDETEAILKARGQKEPDKASVLKLLSVTGGWAAGTILLLEKIKGDEIVPGLLETLPRETVFNYFAEEFFDDADDGIKQFQMQTAFLPQMTERMAEKLSGKADVRAILSDFHQKNLFLECHPAAVLLFWMGTSRLSYDPAGARTYLEKAFDAAADHDPVKLLSWSAIIDTYCLEWNDFRPLDRWIAWMEKTLGSGFVFRDKEIEARVVTTMSAALMLRQPHHPQIDIWTQRSMALTRELADINIRVQKYLFLAFFYFWRGDLNRFRFILKEVGNLVSLPEATPLSRLALPCMESFIAIWLEGEYEKALEKIDTALQYAETNGVLVWNHMLLSLKAYSFLAQGKVACAEESLAAMTGQLDISRKHLYSQYFYLLAWCSYLKNDRGVARVQAATALEYAETTGYIFPRILCLIQNSWILYETGDSKKARVLLSEAKELSLRTNSSMMKYASALIEAGLLLEEGQEEAGIDSLKKALTLGRENGYITPPWWCEPPFMPGLCATALNHDIEKDHVSSIVCRQRLIIDPPAEAPFLKWPWPVRVFTLGRFRLHSWGNPVVFSRKAQKKPLEMLKVLIAKGGSEIGREKITDILWPDADGDMANKSFATTLHRLRQLLGEKQAIRLSEGRVSLDSRYCWVDALFFLNRAAEIDQHWRKSPDSQMLGNTRDVIDLYQGNFLEGHPEEKWIDTFRAKLQQKCLRLLERIGKYREQRGEFEQAILYYEKAIEVDPLAESFYLFLMECYYHLGWPGQIVRTYSLCREQLRDSIDIEPSLRLKNTYNAMLSGQY